jgi:3',5'-cyclic AMP phosphodiesterase CpdA
VPFTVVQLTDPHIGASWSEDPAGALAAAVAAVGAVPPAPPDAVIVSGDVANTPSDAEYQRARTVLDGLQAPLYVIPGNHDDPERLRRYFPTPPTDRAGVGYVAELGPVRLVALDTTIPEQDGGRLDSARLSWLDEVFTDDRATPTLLAMHHPPLLTGIRTMDSMAIPAEEREALAETLSRHRQVQLIVAGHVHRAVVGDLAGIRVLAMPSTDMQLALEFDAEEMRFVREPPCFAVHALVDGRLVSHIQPVVSPPR